MPAGFVIAALVLGFLPSPALAQSLYIQTVAGGGSVGDGPALTAGLNRPNDIELDSNGVLYIADRSNHRVRAANLTAADVTVAGVTIPPGEIATIAGTGDAGFSGDGGPATSAKLNQPSGVGIHQATGEIYVADRSNHRVRRIDPATGVITTFAGTGVAGFSGDGGLATSAELNQPRDITIETASGDLVITDTLNHRIRRVTSGIISTLSGTGTAGSADGPLPSAQFNTPEQIASDPATGALLVGAQTGVRILNPTGGAVTLGGTTISPGEVTTVLLASAYAPIVGGAGDLFATSSTYTGNTNDVRRIDPVGAISVVAGCCASHGFFGDGGPAVAANLARPVGLAKAGSVLYVADSNNNRIRAVNLTSSPVTVAGVNITLIGNGIHTVVGSGFSGFSGSAALAYTASMVPLDADISPTGEILVTDNSNHRIALVEPASAGKPGGTLQAVAGDGTLGFSGDGGPASGARLAYPQYGALDALGNVYVADTGNYRVRLVNRSAAPLTVRGVSIGPDQIATIAGSELGDTILLPSGIAVIDDAFGRVIYFADAAAGKVYAINASAIARTVIGQNIPPDGIAM
ncbi:MAG: hypothetical protein HYY13_02130 [Nitrospirae bacterium]|nr:hypothetical protein [Nitrospirota bacterium]